MKTKKNISWKPDIDPETEDRLAFLKLNPQERWDYIMTLILATYPKGVKTVQYNKRKIEWT